MKILLSVLILGFALGGVACASTGASAVERYRTAIEASPKDLSLHYGLGVALLVEQRNAEAVESLLVAYPEYVNSLEVNFNLALAYVRQGQRNDALVFLAQAEELGAAKQQELYPVGELYFMLAIEAMNARDLDEAVYLYERTLEVFPLREDAHLLLGELEAGRGNMDHALEHFGFYLETHPDDPAVLGNISKALLGRAYELLEAQQFDQARSALDEALRVEPQNLYARYYLAYLCYLQGHRVEATDSLLSLNQDGTGELQGAIHVLLHNCALEALGEGDTQEARRALAPLLALEAPGVEDLFLAGNLALAEGDAEAASAFYLRVLDRDPAHRGALGNLMQVDRPGSAEMLTIARRAMAEERYQEAISALEAIRHLYPSGDFTVADMIGEAKRVLEERSREAFLQADGRLGRGELFEALAQVRKGLRMRPRSIWGQDLEVEILDRIQRQRQNLQLQAERLIREGDLVVAQSLFRRLLEVDANDSLARQGFERIEALLDAGGGASADAASLNDDMMRGQDL